MAVSDRTRVGGGPALYRLEAGKKLGWAVGAMSAWVVTHCAKFGWIANVGLLRVRNTIGR